MKTIQDFKNKAKLNSVWNTVYHKEFSHRTETGQIVYKNKDMGNRPISIVQATQIAFKTKRTDGKEVDSWIKFPKKSEVTFIDENTIIIKDLDGRDLLTYTFVGNGNAIEKI